MAEKKGKAKDKQAEEKPEEEIVVEEPAAEEVKAEAPELSERVPPWRGGRILALMNPGQRAEVKAIIGAEIAKEAAAEAATDERARLLKARERDIRKQAKRAKAGIEAVDADGRGPLPSPYARSSADAGDGGGCSGCGGE